MQPKPKDILREGLYDDDDVGDSDDESGLHLTHGAYFCVHGSWEEEDMPTGIAARLMHPNLVSIVICMCLCNVEVTMASPVAMRDELRPPARVDIMTR